MANEHMKQLMEMSIDELEKYIVNCKREIAFAEDVFALRNRSGEYTRKQIERKAKRQQKKQQTNV